MNEADYIDRTIATVRNHRDADNCWPQWANAFADEIEKLRAEREYLDKAQLDLVACRAEVERLEQSTHEAETYLDELRHIYENQKREVAAALAVIEAARELPWCPFCWFKGEDSRTHEPDCPLVAWDALNEEPKQGWEAVHERFEQA